MTPNDNALTKYQDREMLDTLKQTVAKNTTDPEFKMFIEICKSTGLNPFLREIWCAVPMKNGQRNPYGQVLIMAGRDGYLRVANEHPQFDGMQTTVERDEQTKTPIKATCSVWRKDRSHPITCEAYFNEYYKPSFGDKQGIWDTYKSAMIGKVAEVLALKRSFSINGVVTEEEIGVADNAEPTRAEKVQAAQDVATAKLAALNAAPEVHQAEFVEPEMERTTKISFADLAKFKTIKKELDALGAEARYYGVLKQFGAEKANGLTDANEAKAYKALGEELKAVRLAVADRDETNKAYAALVVMHGAERIDNLIGVFGQPSWDETPMGERDALLAQIKAEVVA